MSMLSVGIDLKELGGRLPKCLKFCQGLKFKADFHPKMSVCRHELGGGGFNTQPPDNCNPVDADTVLTFKKRLDAPSGALSIYIYRKIKIIYSKG